MSHDEETPDDPAPATDPPAKTATVTPRLGKRLLRRLNVRTSVQTGLGTGQPGSEDPNCTHPIGGSRCA